MDAPVGRPKQMAPPMLRADGMARRAGVEVEFLGPNARAAAAALARDLGGTIEFEDPHAFSILGTRLGDLAVEMDLRHVHSARHPDLSFRLGPRGSALLGSLASPLIPRELVTAPIPFDLLPGVDDALASLRSVGARGSGALFLASLGLHFNIDPPSLDPITLMAFLKAFLVLSDALRRRTARGSPRLLFALPPDYPQAYKERVLAPDYWPSLPDLTADYLAANPTRKRALDLLPVLAYLREEQVRSALPKEKIGRRPAFHYRLPHAHLSEPGWSILPDWSGWLAVEQVAAEVMDSLARRPRDAVSQLGATLL
jgi:hypothetical protein